MNTRPRVSLAETLLLALLAGASAFPAEVTIGGARPTTLHVPASYDPQLAMPLILFLHGCPSDASGPYGDNVVKLAPVADEMGILFAAPDGSGAPGQRSWGSCSGSFEVSSAYLRSLIEETQSLFNVDPTRIYVSGYSDGGVMSYRMACDHPDLVAAVAFLAGANFSNCRPTLPVPILDVHGTADSNVMYSEGLSSLETFVRTTTWSMAAEDVGDGPAIVRGVTTAVKRWGAGCLPDGFFELWSLPGVNHFPALLADGGATALSRHMVDWLLRHPRGPAPTAVAAVEPLRGPTPLTVTATASQSLAPVGGTLRSYCWSFGNDQVSNDVVATHTYEVPGQRLVQLLTVSDVGAVSASVEQPVTITCPAGDLGLWSEIDIGDTDYPGSAQFEGDAENGELHLCAAGVALAGSRDRFFFVHRTVEGDFRLTVRIAELAVDTSGGFVGAVCRESLSETSRFAAMVLRGTSSALLRNANFLFRHRRDEAATVMGVTGERLSELSGWVRLERRGNTFVGESSRDGESWSVVSEQELDGASSMQVGVAAARLTTTTNEFDALRARLTIVLEIENATPFHRADPNSSNTTDISDALAIFGYLFLGSESPSCLESADVNNSGVIDISDGIAVLNWLFTGGPEPAPPGPAPAPCGVDPDAAGSERDLGCELYNCG